LVGNRSRRVTGGWVTCLVKLPHVLPLPLKVGRGIERSFVSNTVSVSFSSRFTRSKTLKLLGLGLGWTGQPKASADGFVRGVVFGFRIRSSYSGSATTFEGTNIDATAWEDKKCKGESRFLAQVRIRVRKICKALEEDSSRPVLHHYDGPKFRLELSVPETLDLLDLCEQAGSA
ncbi:unnamed protein product, partial [Arabidopsis halleri]